jgi:hypothetical protein
VNSKSEVEKRRTARHSIAGWVLAHPVSIQGKESLEGKGELRDMSQGGFCCVSEQEWKVFSLLRCEIYLPNSKVAVPTLVQVRWMRAEGPHTFVVGVQYVID